MNPGAGVTSIWPSIPVAMTIGSGASDVSVASRGSGGVAIENGDNVPPTVFNVMVEVASAGIVSSTGAAAGGDTGGRSRAPGAGVSLTGVCVVTSSSTGAFGSSGAASTSTTTWGGGGA